MSFQGLSPQASTALRRCLTWLENNYGGLPMDTGQSAEVLILPDRLTPEPLERLMRHDALAVHVQGFFPPTATRHLADRLLDQVQSGLARNWRVSTSRGLESSDVWTLGEHAPYNAAPDEQDYFDGVWHELHVRRRSEGDTPFLHPLDLLRLQLDEAWQSGAGLARSHRTNQPFSGGLPRVMKGPTRWKQGFIHVDEMGPLQADTGLFSANIYLRLPTELPQVLHIWPVGIRSRWDWYRNAVLLSGLSSQEVEAQYALRVALSEPVTITVTPGDLVLFCVQRPHAAIGFQTGTRISLQCFLQHHGLDKRLLIDS
jgi:hypothetical protein